MTWRLLRDLTGLAFMTAAAACALLLLLGDTPAPAADPTTPLGPYLAVHLAADIAADTEAWCTPWFGDKKKVRTPHGIELSRTVCAALIITIETNPETCPTDSPSEGRNWVCVRARTKLRGELCQAAWQANDSNSPSADMHRWCG